jgi:hypothetical protein
MKDMSRNRQQLEQRRQRLVRSLAPPLEQLLRGSLLRRSIRCGKPSCHCAEGEGHPVVCVGVSLPRGRTTQVSLPRELVPVARQWIGNYERLWKLIEEISAINRELLRQRWVDPAPRRSRRRRGG